MQPIHGSQTVTLNDLRTLPVPPKLGTRHQPVPHAELVDALTDGITRRGFFVKSSQLCIAAYGAAVFGTLDLQPSDKLKADADMDRIKDTGTLFGFRSSTNSSMAIRGVAGKRVYVCSNMCFSGEMFVMRRKSTTRLNLRELIEEGLDKFLVQSEDLEQGIDRLRDTKLNDADAKVRIFDLFNESVLPSRLLQPMAQHYFAPSEEQTDCQPRSLWSLNNAATRSIKALKPAAQFDAAQNIGRHFQITSNKQGEKETS